MKTIRKLGMLWVCILVTACSSELIESKSDNVTMDASPVDEPQMFNAVQAWEEYERDLRLFYAYLDQQNFDIDTFLEDVKSAAIQTQTELDLRRILHQSGYAFNDPHFMVTPLEDEDYNVFPTSADLVISWDDGRYIIKDVRQNSDALNAGLLPGLELVSVGGDPINEEVLKFGSWLPSMSPRHKSYAATLIVNGKRGSGRNLTLKGTQNSEVELPNPRELARRVNELPIIELSEDNGIAYIKVNNRLGDNELIPAFDKAIKKAMKSNALILDLRNTPSGGNSEVGRSIIGHFIFEIQSFQVHERPSLEREFSVPRRFIEQVKPRSPYYNKPVVVLAGKWTGSMGEGIVIGMDGAAKAHTICSDMGDLLGAMGNFGISGTKIGISYAYESLFHVNGTPREDYVCDVDLLSSDVDEHGDDPALIAAMQYFESLK